MSSGNKCERDCWRVFGVRDLYCARRYGQLSCSDYDSDCRACFRCKLSRWDHHEHLPSDGWCRELDDLFVYRDRD